ncbi:MAG: prepilin-type N-terminal cleavage/methylation domain-containing protein [Nitrospinaceae bacterium]|nr:type II secretion system protein [Nitrospinaceae bacterium]NIR55158.1 type II secretion system protein [Nitrospinaceae bacterium]NIS85582.1 type II secretion system protein [Nitrospinaceae bacterium]NIT82428.1 type II secretion system protein [Nitrospinaceae bacterium]NIU44639.1 type II secretion system protein [Nitrospinaceae bacterium]
MKSSAQQGFTIIELLVTMAIIGLLAAVAIPAFAQYKARAYDSETKSHLHNIYLACKGYWVDSGAGNDCTVSVASGTSYGYIQTSEINITATGNEATFSSSAFNINSGNTFTINAAGNIG